MNFRQRFGTNKKPEDNPSEKVEPIPVQARRDSFQELKI